MSPQLPSGTVPGPTVAREVVDLRPNGPNQLIVDGGSAGATVTVEGVGGYVHAIRSLTDGTLSSMTLVTSLPSTISVGAGTQRVLFGCASEAPLRATVTHP